MEKTSEKNWVDETVERAYKALDYNMIVGISYVTNELVTLSYDADELDEALKHEMRTDDLIKILYDTETDNVSNIKKLIKKRIEEYLIVASKISGYKYIYEQYIKYETNGEYDYSDISLSDSIKAVARCKVLFNISEKDVSFLLDQIVIRIKEGRM